MTTAPSNTPTYTVLVPISDNQASALAQACFVASLPNASTTVSVTLTHVLHGEELAVSRELRTAQRVGAVLRAREFLESKDVTVQVMDVDVPAPPDGGILALGNKLNAEHSVPGGNITGSSRTS